MFRFAVNAEYYEAYSIGYSDPQGQRMARTPAHCRRMRNNIL